MLTILLCSAIWHHTFGQELWILFSLPSSHKFPFSEPNPSLLWPGQKDESPSLQAITRGFKGNRRANGFCRFPVTHGRVGYCQVSITIFHPDNPSAIWLKHKLGVGFGMGGKGGGEWTVIDLVVSGRSGTRVTRSCGWLCYQLLALSRYLHAIYHLLKPHHPYPTQPYPVRSALSSILRNPRHQPPCSNHSQTLSQLRCPFLFAVALFYRTRPKSSTILI